MTDGRRPGPWRRRTWVEFSPQLLRGGDPEDVWEHLQHHLRGGGERVFAYGAEPYVDARTGQLHVPVDVPEDPSWLLLP